jgi:hypothetical protein
MNQLGRKVLLEEENATTVSTDMGMLMLLYTKITLANLTLLQEISPTLSLASTAFSVFQLLPIFPAITPSL